MHNDTENPLFILDLTDNTHVLPKRRWSISGLREGPPAREPGKQHRLGKAKGEEGKSGDARRSGCTVPPGSWIPPRANSRDSEQAQVCAPTERAGTNNQLSAESH